MQQAPSSEAKSRYPTQEISQVSRNRNFRFSCNKTSELIPNISQMNSSQVFILSSLM